MSFFYQLQGLQIEFNAYQNDDWQGTRDIVAYSVP